tara:strand:- start:534 stop:749 length:216 start_codon:yes stop_codon:yes gene_type:complete
MSKVKIYIVAVSSPAWDGAELYTFTSLEDRSRFISAELEKVHEPADRDHSITWATTEDTVHEQHIIQGAAS